VNHGADPSDRTPLEPRARIRRGQTRKARRRNYIAVVVAVVLVAGSLAVSATRAVNRAGQATPTPKVGVAPADLMMFAVQGDQPFTAIIGTSTKRPPEIIAVPYDLLTTMPGSGTDSVGWAVSQSGSFGRTVVANLLGAWIPNYVSISMDELSALITQRGGLALDLPRAVRSGGTTLGPGPVKLLGPQVATYLEEPRGVERNYRWEKVLGALFKKGPVPLSGSAESDNLAAARASLAAAKGAVVGEFPSTPGDAGYRDSDPERTSQMLADTFGIRQELPEPVTLLNGIDRPTLAQDVTSVLVPAGFRVDVYGDARGMRHLTTLIYVTNQEAVPSAMKLREALGVGRVLLSKQQSGLSDITVIVGKDYLALGG
jgi:hypothetical protein